MSWRAIVVDGEKFRWTVSVAPAARTIGELSSLSVTLVARSEGTGPRIEAMFRGFAIEDLWDGRRQNVTVTPAVVAEVIRTARREGVARFEHAERRFSGAITSADPADAELAAACAQWFVPYPGRAALAAAIAELGRDWEAVAARFSGTVGRISAAQVAAWVARLEI
jgi:hypothetical protein